MTDFPSYPHRAQQRQQRNPKRASTAKSQRSDLTGPQQRPYARRQTSTQRYRFATHSAATNPSASSLAAPALPSGAANPDASLSLDFARVRRAQQHARSRRLPKRIKRPWLWVVVGTPTIALLIVAIILMPTLYEGTKAYQNVFVERVPHDTEPPLAVINAAGTPIIPTQQPEAERTPQKPIPEWDGKERITILLIGIDRRTDEATRSDTMILVNIDPVTKQAGILSIPRDLKLIVPGFGVQKINAAYAYGDMNDVPGGGPGLTIRAIEANFGIQINYFAEVDFNGFVKIVDTVGGVTLDVPYPIKDDAYPAADYNYMRIYFPAGWQHMDGVRALEYARTRHEDSDSMRSHRQQQLLLALRQQAVSFDLLPKARELLTEVGDSVRTDLSPTQLLQLARLGSEITSDNITSYTLAPALTEEWVPDGPYYLVPDWNLCGNLLSEFTGTKVVPPASALAHPDDSIPIRIVNATSAQDSGLTTRVAQVLTTNGFTNVKAVDNTGELTTPEDTTRVIAPSNDLATALYVAGAIGVGSEAIDVPPTTVATAEPGSATEAGITIVLGNDAPDPAYFQVIPIDDDHDIPPDSSVDMSIIQLFSSSAG